MTLQIVFNFNRACQLYIHVYISTFQSVAASTCIKENFSSKKLDFSLSLQKSSSICFHGQPDNQTNRCLVGVHCVVLITFILSLFDLRNGLSVYYNSILDEFAS
jgi:hypothetical protein